MTRSTRLLAVFLTSSLALACAAAADAPKPEPLPNVPPQPIQAYGAQNPDCLEWTDSCRVCMAGNAGAACSTPGIACQPGGVVCRVKRK